MPKRIHPLISLSVIVLLSLIAAGVLFGVLSSTGIVKSAYAEFGGAAAGFFASLYLLHRWYVKMEGRDKQNEELRKTNEELRSTLGSMQLPAFDVPPDFTPYIDYEHSMLMCYPTEWKHQPLMMQLTSVFSEDPLTLRPGDEVPGRFSIAISSPGQQTYTLKEVAIAAKAANISNETLENELGVEMSERTEALQVPLEKVLSLFGAVGQTRKEQVYEINYMFYEMIAGEIISRDTELVNGRESLVIEMKCEQPAGEPVVIFAVVTYVEETDMIFTFTFADNLSDRPKIDLVRKQVLDTIKFWETPVFKGSSSSQS